MGRLHLLKKQPKLIKWCLERQLSGFQGRINKIPDTCYSFWIGATLCLLGAEKLVNSKLLRAHTMSCQKKISGFGKWPDQYPDVLHTYFSLCGLSMLVGEPGVAIIDPALGFNIERTKRFAKK
jgi:geranylgeranyl transferase type-1 subunit beta